MTQIISNPHVFAILLCMPTNMVHSPRKFIEIICVIVSTKVFLISGGDVLSGEKGQPERLGHPENWYSEIPQELLDFVAMRASVLLSPLITFARLTPAGCGHRLRIHMTTSYGGRGLALLRGSVLEVRSSAARSFVTSYYAQYVCCVQLCGAMFLISIESIDFHNIFFFGRWGLARITAWAGAVVCAQAFAAHLPNCSIQKIHTD